MTLSALKIVFLTDQTGPLFKGEKRSLPDQCEALRGYSSNPEIGDLAWITPDLILRWRREGIARVRQGRNDRGPKDHLPQFCTLLRVLLHLSDSSDEIARWIIDDEITLTDFAKKIGMQKIEAEYIIAQATARKGLFFPDSSKLIDIETAPPGAHKDHTFGIYVGQRYIKKEPIERQNKKFEKRKVDKRSAIPKFVLIIHRYLDTTQNLRYLRFVKLYVPRIARDGRIDVVNQPADYSGMMLAQRGYRYFFLQSNDDYHDFVTMITHEGATPLQSTDGIYISVNIDGNPGPGQLYVEIEQKEKDVTDQLIEKYVEDILHPSRQ